MMHRVGQGLLIVRSLCIMVAVLGMSVCGQEVSVRLLSTAPQFDFRGIYETGASYWLVKTGCCMVQITSRITNAAVYALQLKPDTNACCWMSFGEIVAGPVTNDQDVVVPCGNNIYRLRRLALLPAVPPVPTRQLYFDRGLYLTNYPVLITSGVIATNQPVIRPPTNGVVVR